MEKKIFSSKMVAYIGSEQIRDEHRQRNNGGCEIDRKNREKINQLFNSRRDQWVQNQRNHNSERVLMGKRGGFLLSQV